MPPRKGLATTKKVDKYKYIWVDSDGEEVSPPDSPTPKTKPTKAPKTPKVQTTRPKQSTEDKSPLADSDKGAADPESLRGIPNHSNLGLHQPCQDPKSSHSDQLQQSDLAERLFPPDERRRPQTQIESVSLDKVSTPLHADTHLRDSPFELSPRHRRTATSIQSPKRPVCVRSPLSPPARQTPIPSDPFVDEITAKMTAMIPGGAFVPPNQQRNLRACMVCSVVRTQSQFLSGGCPNCEEFLELAGNIDHVSDCTSSVFDGLITVADTSKSWVARFQRLEGYVAGVYATQVEGILPEEWVSTIEAAGINYIPRDGSEDQMIPKD